MSSSHPMYSTMDNERLKELVHVVGKEKIVLDLSCRKKVQDEDEIQDDVNSSSFVNNDASDSKATNSTSEIEIVCRVHINYTIRYFVVLVFVNLEQQFCIFCSFLIY